MAKGLVDPPYIQRALYVPASVISVTNHLAWPNLLGIGKSSPVGEMPYDAHISGYILYL